MHNYKNFSLHAEVAAINNLKKSGLNADNIVMYVVRINNKDLKKEDELIGTKMSKPCANCMNCISSNKVKKVYFSCE